jgi:hypothetical protein
LSSSWNKKLAFFAFLEKKTFFLFENPVYYPGFGGRFIRSGEKSGGFRLFSIQMEQCEQTYARMRLLIEAFPKLQFLGKQP